MNKIGFQGMLVCWGDLRWGLCFVFLWRELGRGQYEEHPCFAFVRSRQLLALFTLSSEGLVPKEKTLLSKSGARTVGPKNANRSALDVAR